MDRVVAIHRIKPHIILPILMVLSILFFLYIYDIRKQQTEQLVSQFHQSVNGISRTYDLILEERTKLLTNALLGIREKPELAGLFLSEDRERLYHSSVAIFDHLRSEHGITHFYFHSLNGSNFLRVHQKDRFGDEIRRSTMRKAMASKKISSGVELGPLGTLTLRSVLPWWVNNKVIGYLELGVEVDTFVQGAAENVEVKLYTLVQKNGLDRSNWEKGMAMLGHGVQWGMLENWVVSSFAGFEINEKDAAYIEKMLSSDQDMLSISDNGGLFYVGKVPLLDADDSQRGMIVILKNMDDELARMDQAIRHLALASLGLGSVLIIVFYIMMGRLEKRLGLSQARIGSEMQARLSMQAKHIEELEYLNFYDTLTNLPNRHLLLEYIKQEMRASDRRKMEFALVVLDVKRLTEINDSLGHAYGDELLKEVGSRLKTLLRESDTVARAEGDQFAIILPSVTKDYVIRIAEKIGDFFTEPFVLDEVSVDIDVALGITIFPVHAESEILLLQRADMAVRQAKEENRPYCFYDSEQDAVTLERIELFGDLRRAIGTGKELEVYYQPKIELLTGEVIGAEALVRWTHPSRGMLSPGLFIPLAEQTGLIAAVTDQVFSEVAREANRWCSRYPSFSISINLSAQSLLDDELPKKLAAWLGTIDCPECRYVLELTETSVMRDQDKSRMIMHELHRMGFKFSIDDFGTGYSSLSYLSQLPVSELKIDQGFVRNMLRSKTDCAIVKSTINLAHDLGLVVCAEGVEEMEILDRLRDQGCDLAQGYYMSRPMPQRQFLDWAEENDFSVGMVSV